MAFFSMIYFYLVFEFSKMFYMLYFFKRQIFTSFVAKAKIHYFYFNEYNRDSKKSFYNLLDLFNSHNIHVFFHFNMISCPKKIFKFIVSMHFFYLL